MENSFSFIEVAMNVLVTAAVVSVLFFLAVFGQRMYLKANSDANSKMKMSYSEDWQSYNRVIIKGDEVRYLTDRYSDLFIRVVTPRNPYGFFTFENIENPESYGFVDPAQDFLVSMVYDGAGNPAGMSIEQLDVLDTVVDNVTYSNSMDRVISAYDTVIAEIDGEVESMRSANHGSLSEFSKSAASAGMQYYSDYVSLRLYSKLKEVL